MLEVAGDLRRAPAKIENPATQNKTANHIFNRNIKFPKKINKLKDI